MAIKALNPFAPFWYVPRAEQGRENPTRFKIRGLDGAEFGYITPELTVDPALRSVVQVSGKGVDLALQSGLVDWENFSNDAGPVAFAVANFGLVPYEVRGELFWKILAASQVQAEEKKT